MKSGVIQEISIPPPQFCCGSQTSLKKKSIKENQMNKHKDKRGRGVLDDANSQP